MNDEKTWRASCFCGEVQLSLKGAPEAMGYCHCDSCRHWSASPVNAFSLWKPEAITLEMGESSMGTYNKTAASCRKWCKVCGGHVMTEHPSMGLTDVYAAVISGFEYQATVHVNYQESVLPMHDGLPKLKDVRSEMGSTGANIAE